MAFFAGIRQTIREIIAIIIIIYFGASLWLNPSDQMMIGALIGAFSTAIGFFLGSAKKDDHAQPVLVKNTEENPVPVEPSNAN